MAHLSLVALVVEEYDPAIRFFVDVLGCQLVEDSVAATNDGRPKRWVVVRPPGAQTGFLLARADGEAQAARVGDQTGGRVSFFLRVDDFDGTLERMAAAGVELLSEPRTEPYGRVVVFRDLMGNKWDLLGPASPTADPVDTGLRYLPKGFHSGDERSMLTGMLDWYREGIVVKVAGLSQELAVARVVRSETTIAGIVKHLAFVEDGWFTSSLAGRPDPEPYDPDDPVWDFRTARDEPLADSIALYEAACARSRAVTAELDLDHVGADTSRRVFTLRWVLLHMIEETARHLGQLDILRELADGTVGD
jgi:catechol 2,3-dioxygenase-like lactoylglutathione lyase family enzyme